MDYSKGTTLEDYLLWVLNIVITDNQYSDPKDYNLRLDDCIESPKLLTKHQFDTFVVPLYEQYRTIIEKQLAINNSIPNVKVYIKKGTYDIFEGLYLRNFHQY